MPDLSPFSRSSGFRSRFACERTPVTSRAAKLLGVSTGTIRLRAQKGLLETRTSEYCGRKEVHVALAAVLSDTDTDLPEARAALAGYDAMVELNRLESKRR